MLQGGGLLERQLQQLLGAAAELGGRVQAVDQLGRRGVADQSSDFSAIRAQHDDGRISLDREAFTRRLGFFQVAIQVHRNELLGLRDEGRVLEGGGLEPIARRAPHRAPVQQQGFAGFLGFCEGFVKLAFLPMNAGPARPGGRRPRATR